MSRTKGTVTVTVRALEALIDTVERTTDLESVYNDKTGESVYLEELRAIQQNYKTDGVTK